MLLGRRAFSDPDLSTRDRGKINPAPDQVIPLLEKALEVAKDALKKD
jgi:hypothetical protein